MLVRDFMTAEPHSLSQTDTLMDASLLFMRSSFRHLPIVRDGKLVGLVTERDVKQFVPSLLTRISAEEYNHILESTPLSRIMTREPLTIAPDRPVADAVALLYGKRIGCLPVVENDRLVGILTTNDMLSLLFQIMKDKGMVSGNASSSPA